MERRQLASMTSYELYMYGMFMGWSVEYIQFDSKSKQHSVGSFTTLASLYQDWNKGGRKNEIFTALIKWFDVMPEKHKLLVCLVGVDGRLHYENQ